MKKIIVLTTMVISACNPATHEQPVTPAQEQSSPAAGIAPASDGLGDLYAMTLSCPSAALNAAAREAAKVPSQGRYQFAYFKIISGSAHSSYEVDFKSNYPEESDLKYCVSIYCQQGWDPNSTTSVSLMSNEPQPTGASAVGAAHHIADCGDQQTPAKQKPKG